MIAVLQRDKALSDLEEIAIGFIGRKVYIEGKLRVSSYLLGGWQHLERIFDKLASRFVEHLQKRPIHIDREVELVFERELARVA